MGIAVDYQPDGIFGAEASLVAVEELFVTDLGGCRFVFDRGGRIEALNLREGMGAAEGADEKTVSLRMVPGAFRPWIHPDQSPVAVLAVSG